MKTCNLLIKIEDDILPIINIIPNINEIVNQANLTASTVTAANNNVIKTMVKISD